MGRYGCKNGRYLLLAFILSFPCFSYAEDPEIISNYTCAGYDVVYNLQYAGSLTLVKKGPIYEFNWNFGVDGGRYGGLGLFDKKDNLIAVTFANPADPKEMGVGFYKIHSDGSLTGNWVYQGKDQISNESCTPS